MKKEHPDSRKTLIRRQNDSTKEWIFLYPTPIKLWQKRNMQRTTLINSNETKFCLEKPS
jgi:hypothetical protein